jgi:anti-sigma regulatory factor (Ser/Thr protein kinase)
MSDQPTREETERVTLSGEGDQVVARRRAEAIAGTVGFDEQSVGEIGIVVAELAANVLEYADRGEITVAAITEGDRDGIRVVSQDAGPGIDDVEAAFADGHSTAAGLGAGLGAVNRLMDEVTVSAPSEPKYGTHVLADRWLPGATRETSVCPLDFGAASRSLSPAEPNGDCFILTRWEDRALVGVVDGLGHGLKAHKASQAARQYVERHYEQSLERIFEGADRACRGTRGVVMALARFDWVAETVTYGTVGNINHKVEGPEDLSVIQRRGVVGKNSPGPRVVEDTWKPAYRLVMFSDGVGSHWSFADHEDAFDDSASACAHTLLNRLGKGDDDATVLVVTERQATTEEDRHE